MGRPETPALTADAIIRLDDDPHRVVLVERANPPHGLALPGGFVDVGESAEHAAIREAREETGVEITLVRLLGLYSEPDRDPRGHTASAVYVANGRGLPSAGDDAAGVRVVDVRDTSLELAFDHARILRDYRNQFGLEGSA